MKIALFGKMRSGKNTVADYLTEEFGFQQVAFGDGIGEIIDKYFPEARSKGKPRKHYQHIGQELRKLNEDVWIDYLLRKVERESSNHLKLHPLNEKLNIVVTDGRQLNEAKRLKERGYTIIKVTTPEELRLERIKASGDNFNIEQLDHETELQVDLVEPDIEIINNGTLLELKNKVNAIIKGGMSDV